MSDSQLDCSSSVDLTEAELSWLDSVPNAAHDVPERVWCELGAQHPGWHVCLAQAEDTGRLADRPEVSYWAWWDSIDAHEIGIADVCEETNPDEDPEAQLCLLPSGHVGRHRF
jgi:hypothetical protein